MGQVYDMVEANLTQTASLKDIAPHSDSTAAAESKRLFAQCTGSELEPVVLAVGSAIKTNPAATIARAAWLSWQLLRGMPNMRGSIHALRIAAR